MTYKRRAYNARVEVGKSGAIFLHYGLDPIIGSLSHGVSSFISGLELSGSKMPRYRVERGKLSLPLSPTSVSEIGGHHLRSKRNPPGSYAMPDPIDDIEEDLPEKWVKPVVRAKPVRALRSSVHTTTPYSSRTKEATTRSPVVRDKLNTRSSLSSDRPKRIIVKPKRLSADTRLVVDNKTYYKVAVMNNKLRSSEGSVYEVDLPKRRPPAPPSEDKNKLLAKVRKLRATELNTLNTEAENFLFPPQEEKRERDEEDKEKSPEPPVVVKRKRGRPPLNKSLRHSERPKGEKCYQEDDTSRGSMDSEESVMTKKRRRTQAEAFINDNKKYYKFETPCSRLRYQGSYLPQLPVKNNGDATNAKKREGDEVESKVDLDKLEFSFERVPTYEPWYATFQRQDCGQETYFNPRGNLGFRKPFLMPYELGPLPPLNPYFCISSYSHTKKKLMGDKDSEGATSREEDNDDSRSTENSLPQPTTSLKRERGRPRLTLPSRPRKSPRQHASTLAILSSLLQQRKKRSEAAKRSSDQMNNSSLSTVTEEPGGSATDWSKASEPELDCDLVAKTIAEQLEDPAKDLDAAAFDITLDDDVADIKLDSVPDLVKVLEEYAHLRDYPEQHQVSNKRLALSLLHRSNRKRKKNNKTGWPKGKRRSARRDDKSLTASPYETPLPSPASETPTCRVEDTVTELKVTNRRRVSRGSSDHSNRTSVRLNGDIKLNGNAEAHELQRFARRKDHRHSSSDTTCTEVVVASAECDKINERAVNVDLDKWESAEKLLGARLNSTEFQPIVCVPKLDVSRAIIAKQKSPLRKTGSARPRRMPASPKSPRMLRRPRGGWYRDRY